MSISKQKIILFSIVLACVALLSVAVTPKAAFAANSTESKTKTCKFSDFDNLGWSWECKDFYLGGGSGLDLNHTGWAIPTTSYEVSTNGQGKKETTTTHNFFLDVPCVGTKSGRLRQEVPFAICANAWYEQVIKKTGNNYYGKEFNVKEFVSWQIDTQENASSNGSSFTCDAVWPETFDNDMKYEAAVFQTTVFLTGDESCYYEGRGGEISNAYMPVLVCVPNDASGNFNDNHAGDSNHNENGRQYNQWLIVFIQENVLETADNIRTVTSTNNGGTFVSGKSNNNKDDANRFNNNVTESSYEYTTPPTKTEDKTVIKVRSESIGKSTWVGSILDGRLGVDDEHPKYWVRIDTNTTKTIKYTTTLPEITQTKFTPYTLNRNGTSQSGDGGLTDDEFFKKDTIPLACDLNNYRSDNKDSKDSDDKPNANNLAIQSLDTNADNNFLFTFNATANVLGLPTNVNGVKYDWTEAPRELKNKTWEYANGSVYANGLESDTNPDGCFRYNVNFNASTMVKGSATTQKTSSLLLNGENETTDEGTIKKTYEDSFSGGTWSTRFVSIGDYETCSNTKRDSNNVNKNYANWWTDDYDQSKFYEYGTHYAGKIKIAEGTSIAVIYNPYEVTKGTVDSSKGTSYQKNSSSYGVNNSPEFFINVNAKNKEKGIYVGVKTDKMYQPVLYGKWNVVSLAGTVD